jgi:hypothetical protein
MMRIVWAALIVLMFATPKAMGQTNIAYCDAYATLQQCIDAATGTGTHAGTAIMPPNLERDLSATAFLYSNTTLRCEAAAVIKQASGANLTAVLQNKHATLNGPTDSNIIVDGCIVDGNRANNSAGTYGISLYAQSGFQVANVVVKNSTIQNTSNPGIYGFNWLNVEIAENNFSNDAGGSGNLNDGAINVVSTNGASSRIFVHHNRCDATKSTTGCFKFAASNAQRILQLDVSHNSVLVGDGGSVDTLGIELYGASVSTAIQQFVVSDNIINGPDTTNTSVFGISIGGASFGSVIGNTISNTNALGIETIGSYVTVSHNTLNSSGPIDWDGQAYPQTNVIISGNVTVGPICRGIFLIAGGSNYLDTGTVANNIVRAPVQACGGQTPPPAAAVRIQGNSSSNIANVRLMDNIFQEVSANTNAVETFGSAQIQIEGNRFDNNHGTGINLGSGGVNFTIKNNYFNGEGAFTVNGGATIVQSASNIVNGVVE